MDLGDCEGCYEAVHEHLESLFIKKIDSEQRLVTLRSEYKTTR